MDRRPKRRKDKYNPYVLINEKGKYKVSFKDSKNIIQLVEVSYDVFNTLDKFELEDLSQMNEYDRHIEHLDLLDVSYNKISIKSEGIEETIIKQDILEKLKKAISKLSDVQKRRLILYFFQDMTLQEIADMENCSPRAIKDSIDISIKKLKKLNF